MKKINIYSLIYLLATLLSCTQKHKKEFTVTEVTSKKAIGIVNTDSIAPPKVIVITSANAPKVIPAGKPKIKVNPLANGLGELTGTNFTLADGLPEDYVGCIYTDRDGNIWFSGLDGVSKYDGSSFTTFTTANGLIDNLAHCIMQDKTGTMWFGTNKGISKFDGTSFSTFTTSDGLAKNTVLNIIEDQVGNLWFGTTNGISKYDGKTFSTYERREGSTNMINGMIEDKNGNIWFGSEKGLTRYNGKSFTHYTNITNQGLIKDTISINGACKDKSSNLWFGSQNGLIKYDGRIFTTYTIRDRLGGNEVRVLMDDPTGNVWLMDISGGGLSKFDGLNFINYTKANGLPSQSVNCITEDRSGNLWMGYNGGLSKMRGNYLTNFTNELLSEKIGYTTIENDKSGKIWFGMGNGICKYDGKVFYTYNIELSKFVISMIYKDNTGNLWLSKTDIGLIKFDGKSYTVFTKAQGLAGTSVQGITEDKQGNLWIGTAEGLSKFDGKSFTNFNTAQGLASSWVNSVKEDHSGNLWIGTAEGLSKYDGKKFTNYTTEQGLPDNVITSIVEDKTRNLWFSTNTGGISRYDGKSFTNFSKKDGLVDNFVWNIKEDSLNGMLWCSTKQGLSGLKISSLNKGQPEFENYNTGTGYSLGYIFGLCVDNNGIIWGGNMTKNNYFRFDYKAHKDQVPLQLQIKKIVLNNENICWHNLRKAKGDTSGMDSLAILNEMAITFGKALTATELNTMTAKYKGVRFDSITRFYQVPQNLILPYYHNNIGFEFAANAPGYGKQVLYQYMLEGYDKKWSPMSNNTSAGFGNIREGTYTFKLKARSPFGVWSETSYTFKVLPPWWRTWWFRALAGIAFLLLFYGIYRWRTAALRKQKRILEQTVKVRTAEVVEEKAEVERQKEKSDELLLNILPSEVAEELKEKGYTTAKAFDEVTILFSDIKGFTNVAEKMTAQELVKEINNYFSAFDGIIQKYGLEKIKTIGDAYIAAGGLPEKNLATAKNVVEAAIAMQQEVEKLKQERISSSKPYFELRIGIHTGPVVAGVVGIKKFQYDMWGDTVNLAARMEQAGVPGMINISQHTYDSVKDQFRCVHRGKIDAKNKGEIDMYFVE